MVCVDQTEHTADIDHKEHTVVNKQIEHAVSTVETTQKIL